VGFQPTNTLHTPVKAYGAMGIAQKEPEFPSHAIGTYRHFIFDGHTQIRTENRSVMSRVLYQVELYALSIFLHLHPGVTPY
jgi:hypothetical protein